MLSAFGCSQMGTDRDARKRRAMRGQDDSEEDSGSEEEDRLAGLWQHDDGHDSDNDADLSEEAKRQLQHAAAPRQGNVRMKMSIYLYQCHSHNRMMYTLHASPHAVHAKPQHTFKARRGVTAEVVQSHGPAQVYKASLHWPEQFKCFKDHCHNLLSICLAVTANS